MNCKFFSVDALAKTRGIGRTAFQRKILAPNDYSAPVHLSKSNDVVGRGKRRNLTCLILLGKACAWTVLSEGSCIDQVTNSLPNSQTPFFMVFGNVLATPLLPAQPFSLIDFFYLSVPICHAESLIFRRLEGSHLKPAASLFIPSF